MPDAKPPGLSDDEWEAITAHRQASQPKRKGMLRGTDPASGAEFEIELTPDEAAKLIGRHAGLFADKPETGDDDGKGKPGATVKDFFKSKPPAKTA
jgi:hypothetical protein